MGEVIKRFRGGHFIGYSLRFYEGGRRRVLASKQPSFAEAKRMLIEIEARIARGEIGVKERRVVPQLEALVERFLVEYSRPRIKDQVRYRRLARVALKRIIPLLDKRADQVTSVDVAKAQEVLRRQYAPASVKVTLSFLSAVYAWAVREEILEQNPCRGVERPSPEHSLDFLTQQEARRLMDKAAADATTSTKRMLHIAIVLALHTGLRKGELFGLRWSDLDLATRRMTVARSYRSTPKSGKPRHLRLPAALIPLLEAWRRDCPQSADGCVFPAGRGGGTLADAQSMLGLPRLWQEAGLRKVAHIWHCLRHSMASHFIMAGGNILSLQKILGHSDLKQTLVYAHLAPDFLDGELDRIKF